MSTFIQRLLGQAKPIAAPQAAALRVLDTHEARAVAGGPTIRNDPR
jgi:hypothetical protein